jgi:hypothetical protein
MFKKNTQQNKKTPIYGIVDERTKSIAYRGDAYTGRFMIFAIFIDVYIRGLHLNNAFISSNWDLLLIVIVGGLISTIYQTKNKIISYSSFARSFIIIALFTAFIAFLIVSFLTK